MTFKLKQPGPKADPLARALYLLMKAEEKTIQQLAKDSGVADNTIARFLDGAGNTTIRNIRAIFDVFGADLKVAPRYPDLETHGRRSVLVVPPKNLARDDAGDAG